jgi:hypothetical protein
MLGLVNWLTAQLLLFKQCLGILNLGVAVQVLKVLVTMDGFSLKFAKML